MISELEGPRRQSREGKRVLNHLHEPRLANCAAETFSLTSMGFLQRCPLRRTTAYVSWRFESGHSASAADPATRSREEGRRED